MADDLCWRGRLNIIIVISNDLNGIEILGFNISLLHGSLNRSSHTFDERLDELDGKMKYYAERFEEISREHRDDVFYDGIKRDYEQMYREDYEKHKTLFLLKARLEEEIETEMSVDSEAV